MPPLHLPDHVGRYVEGLYQAPAGRIYVSRGLGSSLIPVFSRFLGRGERENAWRLANTVVNYAMLVLAVCGALAWIFAQQRYLQAGQMVVDIDFALQQQGAGAWDGAMTW